MTPVIPIRQRHTGDKAKLQSNPNQQKSSIKQNRKDVPNILPEQQREHQRGHTSTIEI
jgi:hypothetical protein